MSISCLTLIRILIISLATSYLSACATTNEDIDTDEMVVEDQIDTSYDDLTAKATEAANYAIDIHDEGLTSVAAFPTTGSAIYDGYVTNGHFENIDDVLTFVSDVVGEVNLTASFATDDVSARVFNLVSADAGKIGGELNGAGNISEDFGVMGLEMDMSGSLVVDGADGDYDGEMSGIFHGDDADLIMINVEGELDFGDDEVEDFDLNGFAVAE